MPAQSLPEQFPFNSSDKIWRNLRSLVAAVEGRLVTVERQTETYEAEIDKFETLGLNAINTAITPLTEQAIERLTKVANIFSATSPTENEITLGEKEFVVPGEERYTFAPSAWVSIYNTAQTAGLTGRVLSWEPLTGSLMIDAVQGDGAGTYSSWVISVSAPPNLMSGITQSEMDAAIADALTDVAADISTAQAATLTTLRAGVSSNLDTLAEIASAINDDPNFVDTIGALIDLKAPKNSPAFTGTPTAPEPGAAEDSTQIATTHFVVSKMGSTPPTEATVAQVRASDAGATLFISPERIEGACAAVTLTDAATVAVNWDSGINFELTLTTSRILGNPTNGQPGTWRSLLVTQPAAGTAVLSFGNQYRFIHATVPVIETGNAAQTRLAIYCRTSSIFECYLVGAGLAAA